MMEPSCEPEPCEELGSDEVAKLEVKEVEDWTKVTLTVPDVSEAAAFGRTKTKTYFNVVVDGSHYRSLRYSQLTDLLKNLEKAMKSECKCLPKFPGKHRLGGMSDKALDERRAGIEAWLQAVVRNPNLAGSELFLGFMFLKPDYKEICDELHSKAASIQEIPAADWKQTTSKKDVTVWTHSEDGSKFFIVKTHVKVSAPLDTVCAVYNDKSAWPNWSPDLLVCTTVEELEKEEATGAFKEMCYSQYKIPVIKNRDVSIYSHFFKGTLSEPGSEGAMTLVSVSAVHPAIPAVKGCVRGEVGVICTVFTAADDGKATEVLSMMHMDPKGNVPSGLVNTMVSKSVDTIVDMRTYMESKA